MEEIIRVKESESEESKEIKESGVRGIKGVGVGILGILGVGVGPFTIRLRNPASKLHFSILLHVY